MACYIDLQRWNSNLKYVIVLIGFLLFFFFGSATCSFFRTDYDMLCVPLLELGKEEAFIKKKYSSWAFSLFLLNAPSYAELKVPVFVLWRIIRRILSDFYNPS